MLVVVSRERKGLSCAIIVQVITGASRWLTRAHGSAASPCAFCTLTPTSICTLTTRRYAIVFLLSRCHLPPNAPSLRTVWISHSGTDRDHLQLSCRSASSKHFLDHRGRHLFRCKGGKEVNRTEILYRRIDICFLIHKIVWHHYKASQPSLVPMCTQTHALASI